MRKGKIISIGNDKAYGVIEDENEQEIRFRHHSTDDQLAVSGEVYFEMVKCEEGLIAAHVILVKPV